MLFQQPHTALPVGIIDIPLIRICLSISILILISSLTSSIIFFYFLRILSQYDSRGLFYVGINKSPIGVLFKVEKGQAHNHHWSIEDRAFLFDIFHLS